MTLQRPLRDTVAPDMMPAMPATRPFGWRAPGWLRLASFALPVAALSFAGAALAVVATEGAGGWLRLPLLLLAALNLVYLALTGWPGVLGMLLQAAGATGPVAAHPKGASRTALVMPVYNEDPRVVFTAIEAMARSVAEAGLDRVDLFVLSDTQDDAAARAEAAAFAALQARAPSGPALHYRRRTVNTRRKVGNVAEFCERWGARYDYMVVLDADSLMGADAIATLIGLMDANPRAGMIQTVPHPVGRETLFARIQQFAARLYTQPLVEGLLFWQGGEGNYWGHNAIVRIAPFVAHCELPVLPGREPFGGEILCHDVVEAGLMRAAGWEVWVLPQAMDSFESLPANMIDFANRERRWCQGNLQHLGVVAQPGLRPMGRFHLAYGVMHYLAGPAVVAFMGLATLDAVLGGGFAAALLPGSSLAAAWLAGLTLFLLYGAKLLGLGAALLDPAQAAQFGGRARLLASAVLEQLACFLTAPILLVSYTEYVWALLRGGSVRWDAQPRDDRGVSWREGWTRLRGHVAVGVVWLVLLSVVAAPLLGWAAPLLLGLLLAVPAAILSSRVSLGVAARRLGLFVTPEEAAPAPVLRAFGRMAQPASGERLRTLPAAAGHRTPVAAESD